MKKLFRLGSLALFCLPLVLQAAPSASKLSKEEALKQFLGEFQRGSYSQGLETLKKIPARDAGDLTVQYWSGLCESKLQKFAAVPGHLAKVVKMDAKGEFQDAPYVLGQAYYATQDFKKAKAAFQKSADRGYKVGASLYYIGYVENLANEDEMALKTFDKVLALPATDTEMKQPAAFQMGEVYFERAQKISAKSEKDKAKQKEILKSQAIPAYEKTMSIDPQGALALQASGRIAEIRQKFGLSVETPKEASNESKSEIPKTNNGTPISVNAWALRATQDFKYDTNIVNQSDGKLVKVSYTGAALSKTGVFGKYEYIVKNEFAITPELSGDFTIHNHRKNPAIFSNDATNISPAIRGRWDHMLFSEKAALLPEYEFNLSLRDYKNRHAQDFYSRSHNFVLGERFKFLKFGETTIKASYKILTNNNEGKNFTAPKGNISQTWGIGGYMLTTGYAFESQQAVDTSNHQRTSTFNASFGLPSLFWSTSVDFSFALTFTDTMNQYATRGLEKTYAPGVTLTKSIDAAGKFNVNLNYNFTKNSSDDKQNYDYTKSVIGLGGQFTF